MSIQALGRLVIHVAVTAFKLYIGVVVFVMIQQIRVSFEHGWTGGAQISARHSGNELLKPHHKMICISGLERQINRKKYERTCGPDVSFEYEPSNICGV